MGARNSHQICKNVHLIHQQTRYTTVYESFLALQYTYFTIAKFEENEKSNLNIFR